MGNGRFVKGDPRAGRKVGSVSPLSEVKVRSRMEVKRLLNMFLDFPMQQLEAKLAGATTPAFERYLASLIIKGIAEADWKLFAFFLDRMIGPIDKGDVDLAALRAQVEAEVRLQAMPIEDIRMLAAQPDAIDGQEA